MKDLKIIYKDVEDLIPYVNNPRHNDGAVDAVASSIKNFGFKVPIVIDSDNEIVTGHTRLYGTQTQKGIISEELVLTLVGR